MALRSFFGLAVTRGERENVSELIQGRVPAKEKKRTTQDRKQSGAPIGETTNACATSASLEIQGPIPTTQPHLRGRPVALRRFPYQEAFKLFQLVQLSSHHSPLTSVTVSLSTAPSRSVGLIARAKSRESDSSFSHFYLPSSVLLSLRQYDLAIAGDIRSV